MTSETETTDTLLGKLGEKRPILVCVHGFPFDHKMYESTVNYLRRGCDVVAFDLLGFGEDGDPNDPTTIRTMEDFAEEIDFILESVKIDQKIVLCGLSMGGYIAMEYLRRRSDRLSGLILCDTKTVPDSPEAAQNRLKLAETISPETLPEVAEKMIPNLLCETTRNESPETVEFLRQMILRQPTPAIAAAARGMARRVDTTDLLRTISVPLLLLCGENDPLSTPESMKELERFVRDQNEAGNDRVEFCEIPNAGHLPPLEQPKLFAEAVVAFVQKYIA